MESTKSSKLKLPTKAAKEESTVNPTLIALFNAPPPLPAKKKSPPPPPPSPRVAAAADASGKRKKDEDDKDKNKNKKVEKEEASKSSKKKSKKPKKDDTDKEEEVEETKKEEPVEAEEDSEEDEDEEEDGEGEMDAEKKKECTIFVGNVPVTVTKKELRRIFAPYGKIQSIRFRSVAFAFPKRKNGDKKAAFLGKHFHPDRDTCNVYVVFAEKDSALKALAANNTKIELSDGVAHLSVDLAYAPTWNMARAAFVGNLPFSIRDEELRSHFESAGTVKRVRIVRDSATFMGKGFGFVEFENKDDLLGALSLHESELQGRQIRVFKASNHQQQQGALKGPATKGNFKGQGGATSRPYQGMQSMQGAALRVERKRKRMESGGAKHKPKRSGGGGGGPKGKQAGGNSQRPKKARTA
ncbi:RNA recognition motif domain containing protein [Acanthamoeba castellanii str. Neff]|uniref:RNA recognition motif domain containing protein n=1 Tax=Acanthamoeba castellanii (strain ATCC 30010 / Neff) TaxID=1257118 RepID=L8HJS9_ACACF|nr:RNA recognition motif domain containing protein [Acanthamoeba castellanii str. Neff]ELR24621.1 RNA recognition motif domain containing protein [Acanthamoeba castellanii str. Neff]